MAKSELSIKTKIILNKFVFRGIISKNNGENVEMNEKNIEVESHDTGYTLIELWESIKNNILWLLLIVTVFTVLGGIYTFYIVKPMYKSSIDIQIHIEHDETSGMDYAKATTARQVVDNIREYIKFQDVINPVLEEKSEELDIKYSWQKVAGRLSTSALGNSTSVKIVFEDEDPVVAQTLVIALAEELSRRINLDKEEQDSMKFATEHVKTINQPIINPHQSPSSPNISLNMIISVLLGIITGVVFVILKEQFSNIYQSEKDVENTLQLPVIAMVPLIEGINNEND